jgi:hypothetical protein
MALVRGGRRVYIEGVVAAVRGRKVALWGAAAHFMRLFIDVGLEEKKAF